KLALKMANVKKLIHLLSLAVILFSIIDFSNSNIFHAVFNDGKLALKMANVKKIIHLLSLAVILFSIIEFSDGNLFRAPCKDGFYAKKDDKNNKTHCMPCPKNASCYQNNIWCNKNYMLKEKAHICKRVFGTK
ncbi:hypothetical protein PV325_012803, partial [Microctonus aethiopoides]